jgi:bisphosphoglycerate-dependent phosphoglycerate mutase
MEDNRINNGKNSGRNDKGQFTSDNPGKPKGAKNKEKLAKFTSQQQLILMRLYEKNMPYLEKAMERLASKSDKDFIEAMAKFYKYAMPARSSIEVEGNVDGQIDIVVRHVNPKQD